MKLALSLLLVGLFSLPGTTAGATLREIGASELRKIVNAGQTISLKKAIDAVVSATDAEAIEARAFEADGVYYRIVLKRPNGTLTSVIIDAGTGKQVKKTSPIVNQVTEAAKNSNSTGDKAKGQGGGNGNGNGGGNGNGNGGGNGGGGGGKN